MKIITVAGPPSSGKTSVVLKLAQTLGAGTGETKLGVVKFDCLTSFDKPRYEEAGIKCFVGYSGKFCPDHFFVNNIVGAVAWGLEKKLDYLITESAGLCNRCSPYITGIQAVCVIDCLSGTNTPRKIGPMLKFADTVVVTKGDIVSQAEREVFAFSVRQVNSEAKVIFVNGITGQGSFMLAGIAKAARDTETIENARLRFTTPAAACAYCTGEILIGEGYQMGMMRRIDYSESADA